MSFAKKMGREQKRRNKHFKALAEYSAKKGELAQEGRLSMLKAGSI